MQTIIIHRTDAWLELTENWIYNQIRYLPHETFDIHIVCDRTKNLDQFGRPNVHCSPQPQTWLRWHERVSRKLGRRNYSKFLKNQCWNLNPRLVHSHFGHVGWQDSVALRSVPAKHVVTFYGYDLSVLPTTRPIWRERYRELFERVDRVLCEGPFMRDSIIRLGCDEQKVIVQRLGIEVDRIKYIPRQWTPGVPLRVLMVGRFVEKKGMPDGLLALAQLRRDIAVEVTIIGDANAQECQQREKEQILRVIEEHKMTGYVKLLGFQSHRRMSEEASNHHIFLSPSTLASDGDSEGGAPVTLIECMASGMPVVSTRHCDIPSVVLDRRTGLLADEHDIDQLVAQLFWYVEHFQEWKPMLDAGRCHVEKEFNAATQGLKLANIYKDVLQ